MTTQTQVGESQDLPAKPHKADITFMGQMLGLTGLVGAFFGASVPLTYPEGTLMDSIIGGATGVPKAIGVVAGVMAMGGVGEWLGGKLSDVFGLEADNATRKVVTYATGIAASTGGFIAGISICGGVAAQGITTALVTTAVPLALGAIFATGEKVVEFAVNTLYGMAAKEDGLPPKPTM